MKNNLVIKFGGIFLKNPEFINQFFSTLQSVENLLIKKNIIIVHGGGCLVDELMNQLSIPIIKKNGIRITSKQHINLVTGILSGTANKIILAAAKKNKLNTVGLCLSDGNTLTINKSTNTELGNVGLPLPSSDEFLYLLFQKNIIPIISSIGITNTGKLMNVNADLAATSLACMLKADLIFLSDVNAVLDGKGKRIKQINKTQALSLINQGIIRNGMKVKVTTALDAAHTLQRNVEIAGYNNNNLIELLFNKKSIGTKIIP
ncbi:Acetylglutamate kinase [Buchnera aphidicola (Thelaxes suberi)]|uniref:acetylglutamate kinase n=1 Tax=Buchnera aphidicola TaxID=9 RepID=UPI003463E6B0